ncbi:TPA: HD domain-containing protein [Legionella pneumophila subsp. pneumophila]|nr:HD domain-containing protein [Legionella pneumophila]MDI9844720.1 HD domain-containing protein [Legionella pneumophila]HAT8916536.1 HD domain-containing protein [Legionella pneumophila subsp. pneumophila]HAU0776185.1 HD domain-containing protein [Legionella pneumophila]
MTKEFMINDPIHTLMLFRNEPAALIREIINTSHFQRLRNIKQLGVTNQVFPGANHTRFSHSLGVSYITKRFIDKLRADNNKRDYSKRELYGIAAGLLHDIGHGPYSHLFEQKYGDFKFEHEKMGYAIIDRISSNISCDFKEILHGVSTMYNYDKNHKENDSEKNNVEKSNNDLSFIYRLVSSQLDADRMDYLLRDSHFCGVDYGNYDIKWVINSIKYFEDKDVIAFNRKSIGAIEHFLMARRLMTNSVYKHKKVAAMTHLFQSFLSQLYEFSVSLDYKNKLVCLPLVHFFKKLNDAKNHESLVEEFAWISDSDVDLAIKLFAHEENDKTHKALTTIAKQINNRNIPVIIEVDYSRSKDAELIFKQFKDSRGLDEWQLKFDERKTSTYKRDDSLVEKDESIYIFDSQDTIKSIDYVSLPIFSFVNKKEVNPIIIIDSELENLIKDLTRELTKKCCLAECKSGDN